MTDFTAVSCALDRFLDATVLAWIVPHVAPDAALLMPVVRDSDPSHLLGHLPRRHRAAEVLAAGGRAQLLFLGPNALVSSAIARVADWAPTWNFVSASIEAEIRLDGALTRRALEATLAHLDPGWDPAPLGPRRAELEARVIGFSAKVVVAHPRFKLGQDERPEVRDRIATHFAGTPLGEWMERDGPA